MIGVAALALLLAGPSAGQATELATSAERGLTYGQVSTFARLVRSPEKDVAARLAADAQLSAMVAHALEVREARRAAAKNRAIAGFVILGVGDILGAVIMLSTPVNPDGTWSDPGQAALGAGVAIAATGIGLGIAIPALVSRGRQGPEELEAAAAYRQRPLPVPVTSLPPQNSGRSVMMPLLALTF